MTNIIVLIAIMIAAGVVLLVNKRLSAAGWRLGMNPTAKWLFTIAIWLALAAVATLALALLFYMMS
jgi:hypothetical protein